MPEMHAARVLGETQVAADEVPHHCPMTRRSRPIHVATVRRWIVHGVAGPGGHRVRLEAVRLGGRWVTSLEALSRFAALQTPTSVSEPRGLNDHPAESARAGEVAEAKLRALGL